MIGRESGDGGGENGNNCRGSADVDAEGWGRRKRGAGLEESFC
jgi:hypothetical protein